MYQDILKDEWFYVYSDDKLWDNDEKVKNWRKLNIHPCQISNSAASFRGIYFFGCTPYIPYTQHTIHVIVYGIVSFKEKAVEHIRGCFWPGYDETNTEIIELSQDDHLTLATGGFPEHHLSGVKKKRVRICWWTSADDRDPRKKFDLEKNSKIYYIFGDANDGIELDFQHYHEYGNIAKLLEFGRKTYAAQKIPRVCERVVCDCDVKCV